MNEENQIEKDSAAGAMHALRSNQRPSNGRVVHYCPGEADGAMRAEGSVPLTALVCFVHPDERYVNLAIFDEDGAHHARNVVPLSIEGPRPGFWSWPVYVPPAGGAR